MHARLRWRVVGVAAIGAVALGGCAAVAPRPTPIACEPLPDARETVTWGFAATFQESIHQMVHDHAQACDAGVPESVLVCTMRSVGL